MSEKNFTLPLVGFTTIIVYLLTTSRYLPWGDGVEFYLAARNLGVPHPSGYPLFLLFGRILLSISDTPFSLNLTTAIITTISITFLYLIMIRVKVQPVLAAGLSLFFGFGRIIWLQSVVAEIYSLNLLFLFLILYALLRLDEDEKFVPITFYLSGLALTNHLTSIFYIIPSLVYISLKNRRLGLYPLFTILPLSLYLYFPIRSSANPTPNLFNPESLGGLIELVSGKVFHYRSFFTTGNYLSKSIVDFLSSFWHQSLILIPIGIYGIIRFSKKELRNLIVVILAALTTYTLLYNIPDKEGYYLPILGLWTILIAIGIGNLLPRRYEAVLLTLPAIGLLLNYKTCNYSKESSLEDLCQTIYKNLPRGSIIISDDYFVYYGLLNLELKKAGGIIPICDFYLRLDWYINQLREGYAEIGMPEGIDNLIEECDRRLLSANRIGYGEVSKRYCHMIRREIIGANIDYRPIFLYLYDDSDWPRRWLDLHLKYYGLYYQFQVEPAPPEVFPLSLPSPDRYRTDRLIDKDAITVTKKFAAAYNRRGIYRFQMNEITGAISDFKTALEYYPDYYQVFSNLGIAYISSGDTSQAIDNLKIYLNSGIADPKMGMIRRLYQRLIKDGDN
ncbi:MAG TPA: DUF2723 domain-containing protein [bacterium (Candidatus Stahlbacteria)]|nr:DUF2723 domain-containing protein [Candidatus Stahlbacteria bacterium]